MLPVQKRSMRRTFRCFGEKDHDGKQRRKCLAGKEPPQITLDPVNRECEHNEQDADTAGNQIQKKGDSRKSKSVQDTA